MGKTRWAMLGACAWLLAGCAGAPQGPAGDQVRVYSSGALVPGSFELVARLGIGSFWSALDLPQYESPEQGMEGMKRQAAAVGANGLMDPICFLDPNRWPLKSQYFCAGNAIKVKST